MFVHFYFVYIYTVNIKYIFIFISQFSGVGKDRNRNKQLTCSKLFFLYALIQQQKLINVLYNKVKVNKKRKADTGKEKKEQIKHI